MKIEAGKYYVTRGGDVVGPMVYVDVLHKYKWRESKDIGWWEAFTDDGFYIDEFEQHRRDLIKEHVMPTLDLTKPVQTRDGRKVRLLCTDGPKGRPVVGLVGDEDFPISWLSDGAYYVGALESIYDLINTPATPRTFERWFNVYASEDTPTVILTLPRMNRKDADAMSILAAEHGTDSNFRRIARKRVVFTEGEWDE